MDALNQLAETVREVLDAAGKARPERHTEAHTNLDALLTRCKEAERERDEYRYELEGGRHEGDKGLRREERFAVEVAGYHRADAVRLREKLVAAEKRIEELERQRAKLIPEGYHGLLAMYEEALPRLEARVEELEAERDDYRFWNERVRVCAEHTQDVAAPVGDCLICNAIAAEAQLAACREAVETLRDAWPEDSESWAWAQKVARQALSESGRIGVEHPQDTRPNRLDAYSCECLDGGHNTGSGICMCGGRMSRVLGEQEGDGA